MKKILCLFGLLSMLTSCNNVQEIKPDFKSSEQVVDDETLNGLISKYNLKVVNDLNTNKKFKSLKKFETVQDLEKFLDERNDAIESIVGKEFQNEVKVTKSSARIAGTLKYIDITVECDWRTYAGSDNDPINVALRITYRVDNVTGRIVSVNITANCYGAFGGTLTATTSNVRFDDGNIRFNLDIKDSFGVSLGDQKFGYGSDAFIYSEVTYTPGTKWIYSRFKRYGY